MDTRTADTLPAFVARHAPGIGGVFHRSVSGVLVAGAHGKFVAIGTADDDGTFGQQAFGDGCVVERMESGKDAR